MSDDDFSGAESLMSGGGSSDEGSDFESMMKMFQPKEEKPKKPKPDPVPWWKFWKSSEEGGDGKKPKRKSKNAWFVNPFGSSGRKTARKDLQAQDPAVKKKNRAAKQEAKRQRAVEESIKLPDFSKLWFPGDVEAEMGPSMFGDFDSLGELVLTFY